MKSLKNTQILLEKNCCFKKVQVLSFSQLNGGLTNVNYLVHTSAGSYVVRFPGKASNLLINRNNEEKIMLQLRPLSIDVDTIWFDTNSGVKITRYLPNDFNTLSCNYEKIKIVAVILKKLHGSHVQFESHFHFPERLAYYESLVPLHFLSQFHRYFSLKNYILKLFGKYCRRTVGYPCHNDPVPANFLFNISSQTSRLIDWEYGGMNDPLWDLAAFAVESGISNTEEEFLLELYFERAACEEQRKKIELYKICQDLLWSIWALVKSAYGDDQQVYALKRFDQALLKAQGFC